MVAIFTGLGSGFERGSGSMLGASGFLGSGALGRSGEQVSLNAATGNLLITQQDEFLVGKGPDSQIARTYNSLGNLSDDNGDNWRQSTDRRVFGLTGTQDSAGSTITRTSADGSDIVYSWQTIGGVSAYWTTDGAGSYDKLSYASGVWTWTDGDTQLTEKYALYGTNNWRITERADTVGNKLSFTYTGANLTQVTTQDGAYEQYGWSGSNITQIVTGYTDLVTSTAKTLTRTRYGYDGSNRLTSVTTDLSPEDNSIADGKTYVTTYTYDGTSRRVATIGETDGSLLAITYDSGTGKVLTLTQTVASGVTRVTSISYQAGYTTITDPAGQVTRLDYDASNRLTKITAPPAYSGATAQTTQFGYNGNGDLTSVTDAAGAVSSFTYSGAGAVLTATDPLGNVVTRTYGAKNELLTETRTGSDNASAAASHTTRYAYDANDLLRFELDAEGRVVEHRYNTAGQEILKIAYADQAFDLSTYASNAAPSEATMAAWVAAISDLTNTEQTVTDYDARGNVIKVTTFSTIAAGGGGASTAVAINAGTNTTIVDNGDGTYRLSRTGGGFLGYSGDARSTAGVSGDFVVQLRPQSISEFAVGVSTSPASATTVANLNYSFWMYGDGSVNYSEGGSSGTLAATYTTGDNFWIVRSGTTLSYYKGATLSAAMAGTALRTVTGVTGTFYFDSSFYQKNQPVDAAFSSAIPTTPAAPLDTSITNYVYDQAGRLLSRGTAGLGTETMIYDGLGRVTASTDLAGATTTILFTDSSTQTAVTLANGLTTTSTYNKTGELLSVLESGSYVTGGTASYAYDQRGQLRIVTDATSHNSYSVYDLAGRKTADVDHYGSIIEYRYDADNRLIYTVRYANRITAGQLTTLQNPASVIDIATLRPTASASDLSTRKIYDTDGRVIEAIGGDGSAVTYTYDGSSRLVATTNWFNKLTPAQLSGFLTTPPTGAVTPTADARDSVARVFYDKAGVVVGTLDGEGYLTRATHDKAGRKIVETEFATVTTAGLRASGSFDQLVTSAGTSASDRVTHYVYDGQGLLRYQIDALNQVTEFGYDTGTAGQSIGLVRSTTRYYGTLSALGSYTYAAVKTAVAALAGHSLNRLSWAVYDSANRLAYAIDSIGAVVAYAYDSVGNLVKKTAYASLRATTFLPDLATISSWAASATSSSNRITRNYYSARGDLVYQVDGEGFVTGYTYDAEGRVLTRTQWNTAISVTDSTTIATVASLATGASAVTTTAYDMDGNVTDVYDAEGNRHSYVYNANGTLSLDILCYGQADESRTAYVYDAAGRVTGKYEAYGQPEQTLVQYSYDGLGNILTVTDARNNVTTRTYDHAGQLLTETDALSGVTSYQYNAFGEVAKLTDVRGNSTYRYYDVRGNVTTIRDAEDYVTESSYTSFGELASATRRANKATNTASVSTLPTYTADAANDATTSYVYDKAGRLQQTTDALGFQRVAGHNAFGEATSETVGYATLSSSTYDRRGQLKSKSATVAILTPYGAQYAPSVTNYEYDARGNLITRTEAAGEVEQRVTTYAYDKINRLTDTSLPAVLNATNTANVTPVEHIKYDGRGNVIEKDDAAGGRTLYWYDHLDRVVSQLGPTGTLTEYGYDKNGNVLSTRVYATQISLPALPGGTRPSSVVGDTCRETTSTYDALNRLLTQNMASIRTGAWNGSAYATSVTTLTTINQYDAAGNVVKVTDAGGGLTYNYYDKLGRTTAQVDTLGYMTAWTYNAAGKALAERRYVTAATGVTVGTPPSVSTNAADRVTNYSYDRVGNRLTEQRTGVQSWTIASNGTLTSVPSGTSTVTYTYNGLGEVLTKTEATGDTVTYTYDNQGWLMQESRASYTTSPSGTVTPSIRYYYDRLGMLVRIGQGDATASASDRITNYSYGPGGRLQTTTDAAGNVRTFYYDLAGRKIGEQYARVDSAGTTRQEGTSYQYDLAGNVVRQAFSTVSGGTFTDAGEITSLAYNAYGEVTSRSIKAAGAASFVVQDQMAYDGAGRVWRSNAGDGVWRFFIYDANGNQTATIESEGTDLSGKTMSQVLDIATVSNTSTVGATYIDGINATITTYDARNQATSAIATRRQLGTGSPQDIVQSQGYNAFGEVAWDRDARVSAPDYSNVYTYNSMGRLLSVQHAKVTVGNADGTDTANATPTDNYYYDISGRMIGQVDANGNVAKRTLLAGTGYDKSDGLVSTEFHADTGTVVNLYNVYGDLISVQGEVTARPASTMVYDAMGRVTEYAHNGLTDYYTYDVLGQRIKHWNNFLGASNAEKTDYDVQGRVVSQIAFGGDTTTTSYSWDGALVTTGLSATAFGGYTKTTTFANGKTAIEKSDGFGHVVSKTDLGAHVTSFTYDMAGRLTESAGGQTQRYTYLNTGLAASISTGTGSGGGYVESQHSDFTYYASGDKFTEVSTLGGVTIQSATATYDARGRMLSWTETGNSTTPAANISWTYDAAGNIRHETAVFTPLSATGGTLSQVTQNNWFRYDAMNRVVTANGIVVSGQIVRGYTGTDITYNLAGDRATVTNTVTGVGKVRREDYSYDTSGNLSQVAVAEAAYTDNGNGTVTVSLPGTGDVKSTYTYDAMSRLTRQQDWTGNGSGVAVDRQITYNSSGQISVDNVSQKQGTDTYGSVTTNSYGSGAGYALGAVVSSSTTNTKNGTAQPTSSTSNTFLWYDGAVQSVTTYKPDVTQSATNTTSYSYNGAGVFTSASVADGRPRTITATNDSLGQVIRRDESNGNPSTGFPHEVWYRFNGRELGHVSNNGTLETDYRSSIDQRTAASAGSGNFRNGAGTGATAADFGGYDPFTSYEQASSAGTYTVRSGDTLAGIAAQLWGDANLWYKLASANGLSGSSALVAGQTLTLPAGVVRSSNTASTFTPYDPNEAIGDTAPTTPKPQAAKKNKCGVFGMILMAVIAIAVVAILKVPVTGLINGLLGTTGAAAGSAGAIASGFVSGAVLGAAGSIASQGFGVITGIQDKFSWKAVGLAALAGGIGGALNEGGVFDKLGIGGKIGGSVFLGNVVRGATTSLLTQGAAVAVGLQKKFDWVGVAAAGIGAGVGAAVGKALHFDPKLQGFHLENSLAGFATGMAKDIAKAATRSILEGSDFGDNVLKGLPDVVAQFLVSLGRGAIEQSRLDRAPGVNEPAVQRAADAAVSQGSTLGSSSPTAAGLIIDAELKLPAMNIEQLLAQLPPLPSLATDAPAAASRASRERPGRDPNEIVVRAPMSSAEANRRFIAEHRGEMYTGYQFDASGNYRYDSPMVVVQNGTTRPAGLPSAVVRIHRTQPGQLASIDTIQGNTIQREYFDLGLGKSLGQFEVSRHFTQLSDGTTITVNETSTHYEVHFMNERAPDFVSVNVSMPLPFIPIDWSGSATLSRDGEFIWTPYGVAAPPGELGISGTVNWVDGYERPSPEALHNFLTGSAVHGSAAYVVDITKSYSPSSGLTSTGVGVSTPQLTVGASYTPDQGPYVTKTDHKW